MFRGKHRRVITTLALALAVQPVTVLTFSAPARAANIACGSVRGAYAYCPADTGRGVQLTRQLSRSPCLQGQSWGYDRGGVWVNSGCAANFSVGPGGGYSKGAIGRDTPDLGTAIVGGFVGALLGSAIGSGGSSRTTTYTTTHSYSHPGSSWQGWQSQDDQRAAYIANQQRQRDAQDRADNQAQRSAYLANQNNQLEIQAAQDRQDRDNARSAQADAEAAAERARGEADELAQAKEAEVAAAREAAEKQSQVDAQIKQGEDEENRMAREAEEAASKTDNDGTASEETPSA